MLPLGGNSCASWSHFLRHAKLRPLGSLPWTRSLRRLGELFRVPGQMTVASGSATTPHPWLGSCYPHAFQLLPPPPSSSSPLSAIRFYCHRFSLSYVLWHIVRLLPWTTTTSRNCWHLLLVICCLLYAVGRRVASAPTRAQD